MALLPGIPSGPRCSTPPDFMHMLPLLLLLSRLFWVTGAGRSRSSCLSECADVVRFIVSCAGQILGLCWHWGCYPGCGALLRLLLITANKQRKRRTGLPECACVFSISLVWLWKQETFIQWKVLNRVAFLKPELQKSDRSCNRFCLIIFFTAGRFWPLTS